MNLVKTWCGYRIFKLILAMMFFSLSAAHAASGLILKVQSKDVEFVSEDHQRLTISKNCVTKSGFKCQAYSAFKEVNSKMADPNKMPPEIAVELCSKAKGEFSKGYNEKRDEFTLCYFKADHSFVDLGSLYAKFAGWSKVK